MKTKLLFLGGMMIIILSINACSKDQTDACLSGNLYTCIPPIPKENAILAAGQKETDSTMTVSKLPVHN